MFGILRRMFIISCIYIMSLEVNIILYKNKKLILFVL